MAHTQVRDPGQTLFSSEVMLRDMGVPLTWRSLTEAMQPGDDRFMVRACMHAGLCLGL